jgi:hypothetical protein
VTCDVSESCTPQCIFILATTLVDFNHPLNRPANPAAFPIKWSNTYITRLSLPFTICTYISSQVIYVMLPKRCTRSMMSRGFSFIYCDENQNNIPGGVPQHILLSSTCSTSKPMNHDPNETSSFAYLCSTFLTL